MMAGVAGIMINFSLIWPLSAVLFIMLLTDVINFGFLSGFTVDVFPTFVRLVYFLIEVSPINNYEVMHRIYKNIAIFHVYEVLIFFLF